MSRLAYQGEMDQVVYRGKTTGGDKVYPALDFLAMLTLQIPAPREQMVRYVGYYSNKCRGMRRKAALPANEPLIIKEARKTASIRWARLIAKVYLDDPLVCPECKGKMRIVAFIDEDAVIVKILKHVGLWERPLAHAPPAPKAVKQDDGFDEYHYQLQPPEYEFEAC